MEYSVLPKELVQDIDELRRDWGIKGVAIAVVRKGEDGSWKEDTFGLGVADERDNPVTGRVSSPPNSLVSWGICCEANRSSYRRSSLSARTRSSSLPSLRD